MKRTTSTFKLFAILILALSFKMSFSQGCFPNFVYNVQPGGVVNFTSTSAGVNSITTQYYWQFNGGSPSTFTGTGGAGMIASTTYSASGIYTVSLFIMTVPSCSNAVTMTVAVNYTPVACGVSANITPATATNMCNGSAVAQTWGFCAPISYTWSVGATTQSISGLCPGVTYTLVASGGCCPTMTTTCTMVSSNTCNINAAFTYSQGANGQVNFINTSTGTNSVATTYSWTLGNGQNSNAQNPSTTYTANGNYWVFMWASNGPSCWDSTAVMVNVTSVTGGTCNLNANFTYSVAPNGVVNFFNTSTGTNSVSTYAWSFGNGQSSTSPNPSTTYTANGTYPVFLFVSNGPNCNDSAMVQVNVNNIPTPCNLNASFSSATNPNGVVNFASTSTGTTANTVYYWNFGDGSTGFGVNPTHTYASAGAYFVIMTAINNSVNCMSTSSTAINISGINCVANSNFSIAPTNTAQYWTATPSFPWNVSNAVWSWGDGSSSTGMYVAHSYSASGNYQICLSVTVSCGSTSSTCATYSISKTNTSMIQINVVSPELYEVGLSEAAVSAANFNFYPNPSEGTVTLEMSSKKPAPVTIQVFDLTGRVVYSSPIDARNEAISKEINLQSLPNGVYLLEVEQSGQRLSKKLIVNKQ